jgi:hypothetical protein
MGEITSYPGGYTSVVAEVIYYIIESERERE